MCKSYFFGDRSIRRTVHSNDLVKVWVATYSKKETGIYNLYIQCYIANDKIAK